MAKLGVSYFGNRFLSHAKSDLTRIADVCDYVVHTVSEADLTYHKAVMAKIFSESRKRGLEVWADPWGLGGVFGGESFSKFLLEHRDSWQIMSNGEVRPSACLNRPEWRSFAMEWLLSVRDMGAQVIFWDEPHMAIDLSSELDGVYACVCSVCKELFQKMFGANLPPKINENVKQFRRETMKNFLVELMAYAKRHNLNNALCLYAFKGIPEYEKIWNEAATLKDLDIFGCDPYWRWRGHHSPSAHVSEFARKTVESASKNGKGSQVWIQAMRLPSGAEGEMTSACEAAVKEGITHIATWSFDGGELLDPVLSENPTKVWEVLEATYKKLKVK